MDWLCAMGCFSFFSMTHMFSFLSTFFCLKSTAAHLIHLLSQHFNHLLYRYNHNLLLWPTESFLSGQIGDPSLSLEVVFVEVRLVLFVVHKEGLVKGAQDYFLGCILLLKLVEVGLCRHQIPQHLWVFRLVWTVRVVTQRHIQGEVETIQGFVASIAHQQVISLEYPFKRVVVKVILIILWKLLKALIALQHVVNCVLNLEHAYSYRY